jgi:predicted XRE-type DNA-binding protein
MKHDPPSPAELFDTPRLGELMTDAELAEELLARARRRPISGELLTNAEIVAAIAAQLDGRRGQQGRLAEDLGISQGSLSNILIGRDQVGDEIAAKLGYRRVVRYERVS